MTLKEWFDSKPRGTKTVVAKQLGISKNWLSRIIAGEHPGPDVIKAIVKLTNGKVLQKDLRPDMFN
jgi:DNA-binding transcriptional regulator YdaS (Cro superfamily)